MSRPRAPSPTEDWPSPVVAQRSIVEPNLRVRTLSVLGDLLDTNLLTESEVGSLMEIEFRGDREVTQIADLIDARATCNGKAQFLKIFISISSPVVGGYATPTACFFPHATPFVEFSSPLMRRSASPPLRFPTAIRPHSGILQKLNCIQEDLVRGQSEEIDPKLSPSTNVGSSMETSPEGVGAACIGQMHCVP